MCYWLWNIKLIISSYIVGRQFHRHKEHYKVILTIDSTSDNKWLTADCKSDIMSWMFTFDVVMFKIQYLISFTYTDSFIRNFPEFSSSAKEVINIRTRLILLLIRFVRAFSCLCSLSPYGFRRVNFYSLWIYPK